MNSAWLEAVIKGRNCMANGAAEGISFDGLYLRLTNQKCQECFLGEDRVTVDLYLRESNRRYILLKIQARVVKADERGVRLRFNPMMISEHRKLKAIIDFVSAQEDSDKERCEEILFMELLED